MAFVKVVERRQQTALISSYFFRGQAPEHFQRVLGIPAGLTKWRKVREEIFYDSDEAKALSGLIWRMGERNGLDWLVSRLDVLYARGDALLEYAASLNSIDFSKMPVDALRAAFSKFVQKNLDFGPALYYSLMVGPGLEEGIRKRLEKTGRRPESLLLALTSPVKRTEADRELRDFYLLGAEAQEMGLRKALGEKPEKVLKKIAASQPVFARMLKKHLDNYAWLGTRWLAGEAWTMDGLLRRLAAVAKEDCAAKFRELNDAPAKNRAEAQRIIEELGFSKAERETVWAAKEFVYFNSYRTEVFNKAGFLARPLLEEIAKRLRIGYEDLVNCSYEEIESFLSGGAIDRKKVLERKKGYGFFVDEDKTLFLAGRELDDYLEKEAAGAGAVEAVEVKEVRGFPASYGTARGTVRVIMGSKEFGKMRDGDVLVTSMTTPEFVPIMHKASAVVTDEGGILCHAAIVSRELGKPCLIGTKNASKVLKDGETVFVDATVGIVRRARK